MKRIKCVIGDVSNDLVYDVEFYEQSPILSTVFERDDYFTIDLKFMNLPEQVSLHAFVKLCAYMNNEPHESRRYDLEDPLHNKRFISLTDFLRSLNYDNYDFIESYDAMGSESIRYAMALTRLADFLCMDALYEMMTTYISIKLIGLNTDEIYNSF